MSVTLCVYIIIYMFVFHCVSSLLIVSDVLHEPLVYRGLSGHVKIQDTSTVYT